MIVSKDTEDDTKYPDQVRIISTLQIKQVALGDHGNYRCEVSNSQGGETSANQKIMVKEKITDLQWDLQAFNPAVNYSLKDNIWPKLFYLHVC